MNGVHDMGGMHGMGPIQVEKNEPVFHARWEGRVIAMRRALGASGKLHGNFRAFIESIPPADYLRMSYYEKWFTALVRADCRERPGDARRDRKRQARQGFG